MKYVLLILALLCAFGLGWELVDDARSLFGAAARTAPPVVRVFGFLGMLIGLGMLLAFAIDSEFWR